MQAVTSTNVAAHERGCDLPAILADYSCNYRQFRQAVNSEKAVRIILRGKKETPSEVGQLTN